MPKIGLYEDLSSDFIIKTKEGLIAVQLEKSFRNAIGRRPPDAEVRAWSNSLAVVGDLMSQVGLNRQGVIVELQLPQSSERLDVLVVGQDDNGREQAVVIELKQWDKASASENEGLVSAFVGGGEGDHVHPSEQALGYRMYLGDLATVFASGEFQLSSCAFLHNADRSSTRDLTTGQFEPLVAQSPLFTGEDHAELQKLLVEKVGAGGGNDALKRVVNTKWEPSKKLLNHVAEVIRGNSVYHLLENQMLVFRTVVAATKRLSTQSDGDARAVFVVRGGPGTGKSVVAMHLLGELAAREMKVNYVTGSKAFTQTLKKAVGNKAANLFKYTHHYVEKPSLDAIVVDEAHRIRASSNHRFTPKTKRSNKPQIEELIGAAPVSVFFLDERQVVRPDETGTTAMITAAAQRLGASVTELELPSQFRCGGSDTYMKWVYGLLGLSGNPVPNVWDSAQEYEVKLLDSPKQLEQLIRSKNVLGEATARLSAGFCWPWSKPNRDGTLVPDVTVGAWSMPWNAREDARKLAKMVPPSSLWAYDPRGIDQVGCVYTAQGFEYDYAGVIFGPDLVVRNGEWVGQPTESHDNQIKKKNSSASFDDLVKNVYRVLLTRGMRGCYIYCVDDETRRHLQSRISEA
jgi:DUF2075 family protein